MTKVRQLFEGKTEELFGSETKEGQEEKNSKDLNVFFRLFPSFTPAVVAVCCFISFFLRYNLKGGEVVITFRRQPGPSPPTSTMSSSPRLLLDPLKDIFKIGNEVLVPPRAPRSGEAQAGRTHGRARTHRGRCQNSCRKTFFLLFFSCNFFRDEFIKNHPYSPSANADVGHASGVRSVKSVVCKRAAGTREVEAGEKGRREQGRGRGLGARVVILVVPVIVFTPPSPLRV